MANGRGILIAAAAIGTYFLLRGINFVNNVDFVFKKIRLGGSFSYPEVWVTFTIINPTDVSVTIDNIIGDLLFKNVFVAKVITHDSVRILGKQSIDLEVRILTTLQDAVLVLSDAINNGMTNNLVFRGDLSVNGIAVPVNTTLI